MQVLCTCCSEKGRKEKWGMSFLFFPGNKEDGENSEQAWLFLVFTLTVPNLLSINKLAFLSPSSAWAIFCSYYPLTLCSLHPYLVLTFTALSLQITPCSFIFLHYRKKAAMQHTQSAVGCHMDRGSGCSRPGSHSMWHKPSWRKLPLDPSQRHQADNPQTAEQLYQRNSCTVKEVLGPTTDFPTWGSGKGTENPQRIWLWRSEGFHYRTYTGLG